MPSGWRFVPDPSGIKAVGESPAVAPALDAAANKAAGGMRNLAASLRSASFFRFRSTIKAIPAERVGGEMTAFVGSDSPGWHLQEFGGAHTKAYAIIRRGMRQAGIRFEEGQ